MRLIARLIRLSFVPCRRLLTVLFSDGSVGRKAQVNTREKEAFCSTQELLVKVSIIIPA